MFILTSTLLTHTTCWWFELAGSQEITAWEQVTPLALTQVGPIFPVSLPMTMVHAASLDVRLVTVTDRTLMRCGFKIVNKYINLLINKKIISFNTFHYVLY